MKKCYDCKIEKPLSEFNSHKNRKDGKQTHCKVCAKAHQTKWYYQRKFGITLEHRDKLLADQDYGCKICDTTISFPPPGSGSGNVNNTGNTNAVVDHCHTNGHIRGILCGACNTGLGSFRDNTAALISAVDYLQQ